MHRVGERESEMTHLGNAVAASLGNPVDDAMTSAVVARLVTMEPEQWTMTPNVPLTPDAAQPPKRRCRLQIERAILGSADEPCRAP
jgi:hypothetical protein